VLPVAPNLSHSIEPVSTAGRSSDVCLNNSSFLSPEKSSLVPLLSPSYAKIEARETASA